MHDGGESAVAGTLHSIAVLAGVRFFVPRFFDLISRGEDEHPISYRLTAEQESMARDLTRAYTDSGNEALFS